MNVTQQTLKSLFLLFLFLHLGFMMVAKLFVGGEPSIGVRVWFSK